MWLNSPKLTKNHHQQNTDIRLFNQTIYDLWIGLKLDEDNSIRGRTFNDSIIIHSIGDSLEELEKILKFIIELYKTSIIICDMPLRGGLAIGEFDDLPTLDFNNLQKGLVIGTAFIDAYLMESSNQIKGSKLLFGQELNLKIEKLYNNYQTQKVKTVKDGKIIYELKWGDITFLIDRDYEALYKFIDLATKSKWLDHYFGTLETFLINESSENKNEIYFKIIEIIKKKYKYSDLDKFLENYSKSESATYTKRSFLSFIRNKL